VSPEGSLRDLLAAQAWPWTAPIEHHARVHSTSDRLKELARSGAPEGTVVTADVQTGGRGRHGRGWDSPLGNMYASILLRPGPGLVVPLLPLAAGVAVADGLGNLGVSARLKWPNDVIIGERKVGGILAESSSAAASIDWVVIGIGINVEGPLPPELRESATSLAAMGQAARAEDVAGAVLARLSVWYHRLESSGARAVLAEWRSRSVPWWGERVEAWFDGALVLGRAAGLDDEGGLVLEMDDGSSRTLRSGEVRRVRPLS
jgi:BirA family transcriptional regulator, biotin operon repressor / biotin---[acetyl-CoA-carboxylase] ligase